MTSPAIYVRQSVDHPEGIERALVRARAMVTARGWPEAVEYTDNAVSASRLRDESTSWGRMLDAIRAGNVDTIVGIDLDRLLRSTRDLNALIDLGVSVVTVDGQIDLTTADGEFRATMLAGIARFETRRKGERQVRGNEGRVTRGLPVAGKRRYGFKPGNIEEEPAEAERVRALFAGVASGDSIKGWADQLGKPPIRVREILTNPAYAGYVVRRGERYEAHESVARVLDRGLWETVQVLISDPARKVSPGNSIQNLASWIATCGVCGGGLVRTGPNYVCKGGRGGHPSIKAEMLDDYLSIAVMARLAAWRGVPGDDTRAESARARIAELDELIRENVADLATLTGTARQELRLQIAQLTLQREGEVAELSRALEASLPLSGLVYAETDEEAQRTTFGARADFTETWAGTPLDRKRELLRRLFARIEVFPGRGTERVHLYPYWPRTPEHDSPITE